jgi:TolA-binding protein
MKKAMTILALSTALFVPSSAPAVEGAPRISDKEIVERLSKIETKLDALEKRIDDTNKRIDALDTSLNKRMDDLRSEMNGKFADLRSEMNGRFDTLQWMLGLFITISLVILGFVLRMQWQMHRRQTRVETALETQKDEMAFLKSLIEKLLPPRGAL